MEPYLCSPYLPSRRGQEKLLTFTINSFIFNVAHAGMTTLIYSLMFYSVISKTKNDLLFK